MKKTCKNKISKKKSRVSVLFVIPVLILFSLRIVIPLMTSISYSFMNTDGISPNAKFIGFKNYVDIFSDKFFWDSIWITLKYTSVVVGIGQIVSLILAILLQKPTKINSFLRGLFYVPVILSMVAVSFVWLIIFSYNGPLNFILENLGLDFLKINWLTSPEYALGSIAVVSIFKTAGYSMVLYISALITIPKSIYESCEIDGAVGLKRFFYVTLPLIMPGMSMAFLITTMQALKEFSIMLIMTNGGPNNSTTSVGLYIIERATQSMWVGYASAMAVILFLIIGTIAFIQNRYFDSRTVNY